MPIVIALLLLLALPAVGLTGEPSPEIPRSSPPILPGPTANGPLDGMPVDPLSWPPITRENRPWAYNWWPGSAVDRTNLAREFQRYHDAGLGGVHIIPIYGAIGAESRYLEFLSPAWMEMLRYAVEMGASLDLGVDMTTGTGWCFGGPQVPKAQGGWKMQTQVVDLPAGTRLTNRFDRAAVQALTARAEDGQSLDLRPQLDQAGRVDWKKSEKNWKVYALIASPGGPNVKRAAPGGAGPMLNPLDPEAMSHYLERFTDAFARQAAGRPRSMYHDSYEYNTAWAPDFLREFARRRGYRLQDFLPDFCNSNRTSPPTARLWSDYRETVSDLMVEAVFPLWTQWSRQHGFLTRYQAHGSPANLLDLYALADIPETEMFGRGKRDPLRSAFDTPFSAGDRNLFIAKFASSAAHVTGRRLVAAETGTWMAEHFCETLEELKCLVDLLLLAGVNQVFYHGCCYSPEDAAWPGWLFYAATEMNPRNAIWRDVPTLNTYVARCQAFLQSGQSDNEVLLYWPIHDLWQTAPGNLIPCSVHTPRWFDDQPIGQTARWLWNHGYGFDYLSDRQLAQASVANGAIRTSGNQYRVILVPPTTRMPVETLQKLLDLADQGAHVIFERQVPEEAPGFGQVESQRARFRGLIERLADLKTNVASVRASPFGQGRIGVGNLAEALRQTKIQRETLVDPSGVSLVRRRHTTGWSYFIVNQSPTRWSGWHALATTAKVAAVLDPLSGRTGMAPRKVGETGGAKFFVELEPGHSVILRTFFQDLTNDSVFRFLATNSPNHSLPGPWQVRFLEGGPVLPSNYTAARLDSWTRNGDPETQRFAGTAIYTTTFDAPAGNGPWLLDLGQVCHSARVRLNGRELGTLIMRPFQMVLDPLRAEHNQLEVEVTNLSANRIRDLDRRQVSWRIFHDANFVNINYRAFDASGWPVFDSGLLGPVHISAAREAPR